jgi:PAS domain S-box-containing protein
VCWDIHDRKTAEALLRTEEETYRRIVDSVPACVCVGGPTGELLYVNKVGVAKLGRPLEELVGNGWMACIHPDDLEAARQQWKARIAACEPVDIAVRMLQHDGVYRWQRLLAEPSRSSNRGVINWYLVGIEIEETIKAQQASAASEREARELLSRLPGRFATRTEHDFDFISQQTLEETGATLEGIQSLGYLNFIHPDDRDWVKKGHLRSVQERSAHGGLPPVFVDQIQIQQVLLNLVSNGIEATENSGRTPKIRITASRLDNQSVLLDRSSAVR